MPTKRSRTPEQLHGEREKCGLAGRALFAAVFAGLAAIGHWMLFANFALYDDEGYIMMSAREYFAHGGLYELVYSQYGPAFYAAMDAVQHVLRAPIDHTTARWLTLGAWLGTALACAALVWRETTSRALGLFTLAATFLYLYFLPDEPFHPGSFIVLLLAWSTWLLGETIGAGKWSAAAALAGGTSAVLLLTKINVGVFFLAAISAWALGHIAPARGRRAAPLVTCIALPLLAAAVMHTLIRETWIHIYLAVFSVGAITLALSWRGEAIFTGRHFGVLVAAGTSTGVVILSAIWLRGTTLAGLLHGVLLGPLRHPGSYSYPVDWRPGTLPLAILSLALALAVPWLRRWYSDAAADRLVIALRLLQTAALLVGLGLLMHGRVIGAVFSYVAPLLWTWVVPLRGTSHSPRPTAQPDVDGDGPCSRGRRPRPVRQTLGDSGTGLGPSTRLGAGEAGYIPPYEIFAPRQTARRALLATILLLQYLHAYPVGGSQESWGTFLFLPLVALGLGDLRRRWQPGRPAWTWLAAALVAFLLAKVAWVATETRNKHATRIDLGLPGASSLRLEENLRTAYRVLALNASVHADGLFSLPGMFSFNLWTGLPSPTTRNTTLWFTLLSEDEQRAIIAGIERAPRTCIIVQETLVQLMQAGQIPIRGPLRDYIYEKFSLAFRVEGFAFLVRTGRTIAPLGIARVSALPPADRAAARFDTRLDFSFVGDGTPITSVVGSNNRPPLAPTPRLDATNAAYVTTAIDRAGNALRPPQTATWPIVCTGLTRVSLTFQRGTPAAAIAAGVTLYLQDRDGQTRHEARIVADP